MSNSEVVDSVGNFAWLFNHSVNGLVKNFQAMSKVWFYGGVAMKKGTNWYTILRYLLSTAFIRKNYCDPNGPDITNLYVLPVGLHYDASPRSCPSFGCLDSFMRNLSIDHSKNAPSLSANDLDLLDQKYFRPLIIFAYVPMYVEAGVSVVTSLLF